MFPTHFIATVEDLTDTLDYGSEDIDGMDDDAGEEQAQKTPPLGQWTATSSYDIYMVDTPKENEADGDNSIPVHEPPKRQPRSGKRKNNNIVMDNDDNPDQDEDPIDPALEQNVREDGEHSPKMLSDHSDAEDSNYQPVSKEEISLGDDEFVVPEEPLEQERLHQKLIATARSLKKQKQRLKAAHDTLNDRWNEVLDAEEKYGCNLQTKGYPNRKLLPEFNDEAIAPIPPKKNTTNKPVAPKFNPWVACPITFDRMIIRLVSVMVVQLP